MYSSILTFIMPMTNYMASRFVEERLWLNSLWFRGNGSRRDSQQLWLEVYSHLGRRGIRERKCEHSAGSLLFSLWLTPVPLPIGWCYPHSWMSFYLTLILFVNAFIDTPPSVLSWVFLLKLTTIDPLRKINSKWVWNIRNIYMRKYFPSLPWEANL